MPRGSKKKLYGIIPHSFSIHADYSSGLNMDSFSW